MEEKYPKDTFSYIVIEGLDKFEDQKQAYILYIFNLYRLGI